MRDAQHDWENVARFVVGAFRADAARAGAVSEVAELVDELCKLSPEFAALWRDNDVNAHGEGVKRLRHPVLGPIALEYSAFAVDGRPDLSMIVYNPATRADAELIRSLVATTPRRSRKLLHRPADSYLAPLAGTRHIKYFQKRLNSETARSQVDD